MIKAVTFDLWDTMIHDDSDEAKRKAQGLRSKKAERRHLLWAAVNAVERIDAERVNLAYDVADAAFNHVWHDLSVTWTIAERLRVALEGLGRELPEAAFAKVVAAHESMEVEVPPDTVDGIEDALAELAQRYKLCVVSDTIVTTGTGLRALLEGHGLKRYFSGFAFSDEVGHSKPHRAMFDAAAKELGVAMEEMVHIGDRDHNDVKGPQTLGMKAVLFIATRAHDKDSTSADAICARHADLPGVIDGLAAS
jgi:putative hydrolase of the HAD superfamily